MKIFIIGTPLLCTQSVCSLLTVVSNIGSGKTISRSQSKTSLSASSASEIDFKNCTFVLEDNISGLEEQHYSLNDLADCHKVDISEFMSGARGSSNKAAVKIINAMLHKAIPSGIPVSGPS